MENNETSAKKPRLKLRIIIIAVSVVIVALLIFVYLRVNPKWKAAKLTVKQSGKSYGIENIDPEGMTLQTRIKTPDGYKRIEVGQGSFGEYLRDYKLLPDGSELPVYDGTTISAAGAAAIFDISLGDDGYQQCADSIIRLYSDYFYEKGEYDKISFMFSNGDVCDYNRWRKGKRMLVFGDHSFEIPAALSDDSEQQYRNYLKEVMNYAGTLSLQKESQVIDSDELKIGDIICNDSHVVMIVDIAVNEKGEKCYLIGQSFIPAVCFHVIVDRDGRQASPWFTQERLDRDSFKLGDYTFKKENIRRWKDGF
jgi:hypothetical protein